MNNGGKFCKFSCNFKTQICVDLIYTICIMYTYAKSLCRLRSDDTAKIQTQKNLGKRHCFKKIHIRLYIRKEHGTLVNRIRLQFHAIMRKEGKKLSIYPTTLTEGSYLPCIQPF